MTAVSSRLAVTVLLLVGVPGAGCGLTWAAEIVGQKDYFDTGRIESNDVLVEKVLDENQISGIISDQTMTQIGRGFMQGFLKTWRDLDGRTQSSNMAVYERPSARYGSLIWVEQNFARVFQTFIFPGRGSPDAVGDAAARWVHQRVADLEAEKVLFSDPDMAKDEF